MRETRPTVFIEHGTTFIMMPSGEVIRSETVGELTTVAGEEGRGVYKTTFEVNLASTKEEALKIYGQASKTI